MIISKLSGIDPATKILRIQFWILNKKSIDNNTFKN